MRVTVFNGSPRGRRSNTHEMVAPLLEGAREAGAQAEEVFLVEHDIRQCMGCFACWGNTPGVCALDDDMSDLMDLFLESDYVGMASPVYNMYMTALLKNFTDRLLPLATPHIHRAEEGRFYHEGRVVRTPEQFFMANSGFPGEHDFDLFRALAELTRPVLQIYRNCGEVLRKVSPERYPELGARIEEYRDVLRQTGRELVTSGGVSDETAGRLNMQLLSDEEYMAAANRFWDERIEGQDP